MILNNSSDINLLHIIAASAKFILTPEGGGLINKVAVAQLFTFAPMLLSPNGSG